MMSRVLKKVRHKCAASSKYCLNASRKLVSDRIASYAMQEADAMVFVKVMRIPCFGRRMTIGRASISWPGAS